MIRFARTAFVLTSFSFLIAPALAAEKAAKSEAKATGASGKKEVKNEEGKEVTLSGKVVDVACYTMGMATGDHAKCTADCLKAGVPAALETPKGLVLLGKGHKGAGDMLAEHAFQEVKIKGKLYSKGGVKFLSIESVEKAGTASARPESKPLARAAETGKNVRIYPPAQPSKTESKASVLARNAAPARSRTSGAVITR